MEAFDLFPAASGVGQHNAAAERTVDAATAYFSARAVIAFAADREGFVPLAVRGAEHRVVDAIAGAAATRRSDLSAGRALSGAAAEVEVGREGNFVLAPVREADQVTALLYVQTDGARLRDSKDLSALVQFCRMLGAAINGPVLSLRGGVQEFLEHTPSDEVARQQLLTLLERHEWNIARVARALGTTRTTIYKRLERYGAERLRVPKTVRRPRLA